MGFLSAVGRGLRDWGLFALVAIGAFISIPGLVVHRLLARRLERRGRSSRLSVIALAPVITLVGIWWLALMARDEEQGLATAGTSAALVTVTALIYWAIVPRRGMPAPPPPVPPAP